MVSQSVTQTGGVSHSPLRPSAPISLTCGCAFARVTILLALTFTETSATRRGFGRELHHIAGCAAGNIAPGNANGLAARPGIPLRSHRGRFSYALNSAKGAHHDSSTMTGRVEQLDNKTNPSYGRAHSSLASGFDLEPGPGARYLVDIPRFGVARKIERTIHVNQLEPGEIPSDWAMPQPAAVRFYGNLIVAEVMEAMPHSPVVLGFRHWLGKHDRAVTELWGHPDILAARRMTGLTRAKMSEATCLTEQQIEALEVGVTVPSLGFLLMLAFDLNWPVGAFFRSELHEWHPRSALGRAMAQVGDPGSRRYDPDTLLDAIEPTDEDLRGGAF